jgi:hypothetical protein
MRRVELNTRDDVLNRLGSVGINGFDRKDGFAFDFYTSSLIADKTVIVSRRRLMTQDMVAPGHIWVRTK